MLYDISLSLTYEYDHPVGGSRHQVRVMPRRDLPGQKVFRAALTVEPAPAETTVFTDFFGNDVTGFAYRAPHERLDVSVTARLEILPASGPDAARSVPFASLGAALSGAATLAADSPHHFLGATAYTAASPGLRDWMAKSIAPDCSVLAIADALTKRLRDEFRYDGSATDVMTTAATAFKGKHGVCQDFSHVLIAGLRAAGIPAAYVSGCLRTEPPPGQERLQGADAMHAWVQVWTGPVTGWVGFDPTNGIRAGEDHIIFGIGRDYADVTPILGRLKTSGEHAAGQSVDVVPVRP